MHMASMQAMQHPMQMQAMQMHGYPPAMQMRQNGWGGWELPPAALEQMQQQGNQGYARGKGYASRGPSASPGGVSEGTTAATVEDANRNSDERRSKTNKQRRRRKVRNNTHSSSNKVFVGGLAQSTTQQGLAQHFAELVGANVILSTAVLVDSHSKRSRGFGFVEFLPGFDHSVVCGNQLIEGNICGVRSYDYKGEKEKDEMKGDNAEEPDVEEASEE